VVEIGERIPPRAELLPGVDGKLPRAKLSEDEPRSTSNDGS
jgi:hypothetical protein